MGLAAALGAARGSIITLSTNCNLAIPDGNLNGIVSTITVQPGDLVVPSEGSTILDVNLILDIAGGWNGDLYAYLFHDNVLTVMLNRPGRTAANPDGYSHSGFSTVTLDDQATTDIHLYGTVTNGIPAGSWQPDARSASPFIVVDTDTRDSYLAAYNGMDALGEWTLFVADVAGGDHGQLVSWSIQIEVPEPSSLGLLGLAALLWRRRRLAASRS